MFWPIIIRQRAYPEIDKLVDGRYTCGGLLGQSPAAAILAVAKPLLGLRRAGS